MAEPVPSQETQSRPTLRLVDLNTQAVLVSFLTGGFGVLSGYAVFFLCLEEANRPRLFAMALLIAAMLSTAYEFSS